MEEPESNLDSRCGLLKEENTLNCWYMSVRNWGRQGASLRAQLVKNLPVMQETWVRSLGGKDPLEKEMATHSSIHSCLENPMVRAAWWATVCGAAKSQTQLSD